MEKIIKVALTLFSLGLVGIGGFTLINLDLRTEITNEAPEPDPEATDNANYLSLIHIFLNNYLAIH